MNDVMILELHKKSVKIKKSVSLGTFGKTEVEKELSYKDISKKQLRFKLLKIVPYTHENHSDVLKCISLTVETIEKEKGLKQKINNKDQKLGDMINKLKYLGTVKSTRFRSKVNRIFESENSYVIESNTGKHLHPITKRLFKLAWNKIRSHLLTKDINYVELASLVSNDITGGTYWLVITVLRHKKFIKAYNKMNEETNRMNTYIGLAHEYKP